MYMYVYMWEYMPLSVYGGLRERPQAGHKTW